MKLLYSSLPRVGEAALWKSGLFPFFVDARRVNCETENGEERMLVYRTKRKGDYSSMDGTMMAGHDVR